MLTTNLLQAMLVKRAEQSHQHWQSSNNALLMRWVHTQSKSKAITTQSLMHWSLHIHRMTAAYMLQLIYNIYTYIAKTRLSFCTSTCLRDAVNQSIFRFIRLMYMHRNHIHCKDMTQSLLIYTEWQQRLCACVATNIRHSHSHCKDTIQLLRTYTLMQCSKSIDFSIFWSIYMRHKYIDQNSFSLFNWVIIQWTWKLMSKWSAFIYINQSSSSSLSLIIIQTSRKLMSKWSAFTILSCLKNHLII